MSAATNKLFGKKQFDQMKQGSVFVNTARYVLSTLGQWSIEGGQPS